MGLFNMFETKPGPGVRPDEPRKKGLARLAEVIARDWGRFLGAGALAALSILPYAAGMVVSVETLALLPMLVTCPLGGMLAAPALVGLADTILRSLRDEPGYWWPAWRRAWRQNWKAALLPGAAGGLLFGGQLFMLRYFVFIAPDLGYLVWVALGAVLAAAVAGFLVPLLALLDAPLPAQLRNAVLLCFRRPLRTLAAAAVQFIYWGAVTLLYPYSLPVFCLTTFWLPELIALQILYPPLEQALDLEKRVRAVQEKEREEE